MMRLSTAALCCLVAVGCGVPEAEHQEALKDLNAAQAQLEHVNQRVSDLEAEIAQLRETDEGFWREILVAEDDADWATVRMKTEDLLRRWPQSPYASNARELDKKAMNMLALNLFQKGEIEVEKENFERARKIFQDVTEKFPSSSVARQATRAIRGLGPKIKEAQIRAVGNGNWYVREQTSQVDDSTNVYLSLQAADTIKSRFGESVWPEIYIRCKENRTEVYVNWGVYLGVDQTHVLQRLDDKKATTALWGISTDHKATFYRGSHIAFARQLMNHDKLLLQTTPYGENPVIVNFKLVGLLNAIRPLRKACGW